MNIESWIALGALLVTLAGALVALAMRIATIQARLTGEVEARKEAAEYLEKSIEEEELERRRNIVDMRANQARLEGRMRRLELWQAKQDGGGRPPHETPDSDNGGES